MGYTKLFSSIVASSIWSEDLATRIVWVTMLALKNERHMVESSLSGLAHLARVTEEECERAVKLFESPDPDSSNPEHEGRKIEKCVGGWRILNGEYYRAKLGPEDRREYQRVYQAEYRKKHKRPKRAPKEPHSTDEHLQVRQYEQGSRSLERLGELE